MSEDQENPDKATDSFVQRWSRRKLQQREAVPAQPQQSVSDHKPEMPPPPEQIELPSIDSLHEDSEVDMFFSEGISDNLKRQALRKLFHFGKFNVCDGLDDYAEDYTFFEPLTSLFDARRQLQDICEKLGENPHAPEQDQPLAAADEATPKTFSVPTADDDGSGDDSTREE